MSVEAKHIIVKKRQFLRRKSQRLKAKAVFKKNFLGRRTSKSLKNVAKMFPDIGPDIGRAIEVYVSNCNVGADSWRRTGVLTFDGNVKQNKKVTYERIQHHLEEKYSHKFS